MTLISRVLDSEPVVSLADYVAGGGGAAVRAVRARPADEAVALVAAAGIRGRGGAGFPTATKWKTVAANASPVEPTSVVINAAEGEPGSFKDRELLRRNPYRTIEGALIAAHAVGATKIVFGMKRSASAEIARVHAAVEEARSSGWLAGIEADVVAGPPEYLLGEETALLEVVAGRLPFPRVAPPFRRGADEVVEHQDDVGTGSGLSAHVEMAAAGGLSYAPPSLVDNVETLAHVTLACAHGVDWFRSIGTEESPGSIVCTVSGATRHAGVGEFAMGTPLRVVIDELGGGLPGGRHITAVLQGVSAAVITPDRLDTPLTWESMSAIGSGLGATAFIVFDDTIDPLAIAAAVSRFLGVESCGQCTPCKQDGMAISDALERLCTGRGDRRDADAVRQRLTTVADSARCSLATQHQDVVGSLVSLCSGELDERATVAGKPLERACVLPLLDVTDGRATSDENAARKQPDWTFADHWHGQAPVDRLDDHRSAERL